MKRAVLALVIVFSVVFVSAGMLFAQEKKAPATITLTPKVKTMGPVTFNHAKHSAENKCDVCHATATGGALKTANAKPSPYHATMAKEGLCIDCHNELGAAGKKVPKRCPDCHKKAA